MTTRTLNCSVSIGGVDFSSYVRSIKREHYICRPVGTATISVDPDNALACTPGSAVSISEMGTQRFTGYVCDTTKGHMEPLYEIVCQDELKKLSEYNFVDEAVVANGETITYWIHYFLDRVGITSRIVAETIDTVPPGIEFHLESCMDIVKKLCNTQGWQMYADASGTVHVGDFLIPGTPTNISNTTRVSDLSDDSWLRNEVVVFGYGNVKGEITTTIPELGTETRSAVLANPYIRTQEQAQAIAAQMMGYFDTPLDTKEIAMEGGERASYLLENVGTTDGYVGTISGQVTGLETTFAEDGYIQTHYLNERCPGFWALGSGSPTGGSCFIGHKSAGVYRYDYPADVATAKNTGLAGTALECHDLKVDPHFYGDGRRRVWRVTAGGVYKSDDDAETWQVVNFPDPVNAAGDSPAPTVSDLTFYGMAFDKILRGVVYVLAGYITPNDRLWLYKTEDFGDTWVSVAVYGQSPVGSGWTRFFTPMDFTGDATSDAPKHLVNFRGDLYCVGYTAANYGGANVHRTGIWRYTGVGNPTCVFDATQGATWKIEEIHFLVEVGGFLVAVYNGIENNPPAPDWRKIMAWCSSDGVTWTKILDTSDGTGIGVTWTAPNDYGYAYAAVGANFTLLIGVTRADDSNLSVNPIAYIWGCSVGTDRWWVDWAGDETLDGVDVIRVDALGKSKPTWSVDPDIVWMHCTNSGPVYSLYTRLFEEVWAKRNEGSAFPRWYDDNYDQYLPFEGHLYAINGEGTDKLYETKDGTEWREVSSTDYTAIGTFEERIVLGRRHRVYIQSLLDYIELDWFDGYPGSGIDLGFPNSFAENWDHLWLTSDKGLWRRDNGRPSWRMSMRRSAMTDQGHQYSLATLPNIPWIVYVAAARESGGDEYIRLLRIHAENFDSAMSHTYTSGSAMGLIGMVRVTAPPRSGSCIDEIVYSYGYGVDDAAHPTVNKMVYRFESGQAPVDKTDVTWPGYLSDTIMSLLHQGDEDDLVAIFYWKDVRGTTNGGDDWDDLTDVTIIVDGADRASNAIVAGRYSGGSPMINYSPDRAINWSAQGDGISTADGIASVQIYDKTRIL